MTIKSVLGMPVVGQRAPQGLPVTLNADSEHNSHGSCWPLVTPAEQSPQLKALVVVTLQELKHIIL